MDETKAAAVQRINQVLAEETANYDFDLLRDRFKTAYFQGADGQDPHRTFTIKPPSGYELAFDEADVLLALFGEDSTIWKLFLRKHGRQS